MFEKTVAEARKAIHTHILHSETYTTLPHLQMKKRMVDYRNKIGGGGK